IPLGRSEPEHEEQSVAPVDWCQVLADELVAHGCQDVLVPAALDLDGGAHQVPGAGDGGLDDDVGTLPQPGAGLAADFHLAVDDQAPLADVSAKVAGDGV